MHVCMYVFLSACMSCIYVRKYVYDVCMRVCMQCLYDMHVGKVCMSCDVCNVFMYVCVCVCAYVCV